MKKTLAILICFFCLLSRVAIATDQLDHRASLDSEYQEILALQYLAETQHYFSHADFTHAYESS